MLYFVVRYFCEDEQHITARPISLSRFAGRAFDITYVRLKFHSMRPESFAIYKRTSKGSPWIPYQYYSSTCHDTYGVRPGSYVTRDDETRALCTGEYSGLTPLTGGNVAFSTLEGRPSAFQFETSHVLQVGPESKCGPIPSKRWAMPDIIAFHSG